MKCVILVAGHGTQLESDIREKGPRDLVGVPKALLPGVNGKKILDSWWCCLNQKNIFSDVYLVTNADKYKHYERWATANQFPIENIINDGTTTAANAIGAVTDFQLAINTRNIDEDVLVVAGDMLFDENALDITQVVRYFQKIKKTAQP